VGNTRGPSTRGDVGPCSSRYSNNSTRFHPEGRTCESRGGVWTRSRRPPKGAAALPCVQSFEALSDRGLRGAPCSGTCIRQNGTNACAGNSPINDATACYAVDGLFCGPSGTCEAAAGVGSPCTREWGSCVNSFCSASGVCRPFLGEGADCLNAPDGCADGLLCGSDSGTCSSFSARAGIKCTCLRLKEDGEACRYPQECKSAPCSSGICSDPPNEKELDEACPS
jgi:hypothetical protein